MESFARVESYASVFARTLKIQIIGSHIPLVGMGSAALVAAVALSRHGDLNFQKDTNDVSVLFKVHSSLHFRLGDNWEKLSCTTEMKQMEFPAAGQACKAILLPTSGLKEESF